jgi:hypothetical protein
VFENPSCNINITKEGRRKRRTPKVTWEVGVDNDIKLCRKENGKHSQEESNLTEYSKEGYGYKIRVVLLKIIIKERILHSNVRSNIK